MIDCLSRNESPIASHLLWPGILDDAEPWERELGIEAGLAWGKAADATVVYEDYGISPGMQVGIERAERERRLVMRRLLPSFVCHWTPDKKIEARPKAGL